MKFGTPSGTKGPVICVRFYVYRSIFGEFWPENTKNLQNLLTLLSRRGDSLLNFSKIYVVYAEFPFAYVFHIWAISNYN